MRSHSGPKICVKVGSIAASCPACGQSEFQVVRGHKALAVYQCCACGAETTRTKLLVQISGKVVEDSRKLLQSL